MAWRILRTDPSFGTPWGREDPIAWLRARAQRVHRDLPERRTFRFEHDGRGYFAKEHRGVGLRELLKNLLVARLPVFDAEAEADAVIVLRGAGVPTLDVVALGIGAGPAPWRRSFVVTREIVHRTTLDALARAPGLACVRRRGLIRKVAARVRRMHDAGVNHRDLYLVHFLLDDADELRLIDLHRAQRRPRVPTRWRAKDLAALLFSATAAASLSRGDALRFVSAYEGRSVRDVLRAPDPIWRRVMRRAERMRRRGARG